VDFLPENMPQFMDVAVRFVYYLGMFGVTAIFLWFGRRFFMMGFIQRSEITGMNLAFIFVTVPLSGLTWLLFLIEALIREVKGLPKIENAAFPEADEMEDLA
jgi:TRAP-type C4-dicarboxylate transport system permease small subunit